MGVLWGGVEGEGDGETGETNLIECQMDEGVFSARGGLAPGWGGGGGRGGGGRCEGPTRLQTGARGEGLGGIYGAVE